MHILWLISCVFASYRITHFGFVVIKIYSDLVYYAFPKEVTIEHAYRDDFDLLKTVLRGVVPRISNVIEHSE